MPEVGTASGGGGGAEIRTARLLLRPFAEGDLGALVAYRRDPEVARYQSWSADYTMADAERLLVEHVGLRLGRPGAWVQLAAVEAAGGEVVGDCASHVLREPPHTAEIGVTLARAHQGRGLAHEALRGLVTALFERHAIRRVIAQADDRNLAVHRLLDRLGFRLEARFVEADWFKGEWATLRVYAVLHTDWEA